MSPKKEPFQKECSLPTSIFQGDMLVFGELHPRKLPWNPKMDQNGDLEDDFPLQLGDF